MSVDSIGFHIATLRKEKGVTQEDVAKFIGVTSQAVSKWENGGVPDTELLPKIADFFSVSLDSLFGRTPTQSPSGNDTLVHSLLDTKSEDRFAKAFEACWDMERALMGHAFEGDSIVETARAFPPNHRQHSRMLFDEGFTCMSLLQPLQYFLLVPESQNKDQALLDRIDYPSFFAHLSDPNVFSALIFLNKREDTSSFTPGLLEKHLQISHERALEVIGILKKYHFIKSTFIELDDEQLEFFRFQPTPSFFALLIFAREMIETPNSYSFYCQKRSKPYLL